MSAVRTNLALAAALFGLELLLGIGLIGATALLVALICLVLFVSSKESFPNALRLAAIYSILGISTLAYINLSWKVAVSRAGPVITAVNSFHARYNRYPESLEELVPRFLPAIPNAGLTASARHFGYAQSPPSIYFLVMFHGVASYDFQSQKWLTNE